MNNMWKKIFILLCAYLSAIAFAVIGGVVWYKNSEDEEVKKTLKLALILTLIFTGISALLGLYNYIGGLWSHYYSSSAYEVYSYLSDLVNIAKIITFAVFIIKVFFEKSQTKEVVENQTINAANKKQPVVKKFSKSESVDKEELK